MQARLRRITKYIWEIAEDVLRDRYVHGKHRVVILPMAVPRKLDAVQKDMKQNVLDVKVNPGATGITSQA